MPSPSTRKPSILPIAARRRSAVSSVVAVSALYPSTPRCRITAHAIAIGAPGRVPWMFGDA